MPMTPSDVGAQRAAGKLVEWLRGRVIQDATGETSSVIETQPSGTFWLGRLAPEQAVFNGEADSRGDRLDPCSMGIRFLPVGDAPWIVNARIHCCAWLRDEDGRHWRKTPAIDVTLTIKIDSSESDVSFGEDKLRAALRHATGIECLSARIDISTTTENVRPEITITLVNSSPKESKELEDTRLYECSLQVWGCAFEPYLLEALPDSFRYDRRVPAYGINCGVVTEAPGTLITRDDPTTDRFRPRFWPVGIAEPSFKFSALALDPIPLAEQLLSALRGWGDANWGVTKLKQRRQTENWSDAMFDQAQAAGEGFWAEWRRIAAGVRVLSDMPELADAFKNMNAAMAISASGKYDAWRPFQFGFLLANLEDLVSETGGRGIADVVWFATGGGKTETYLGLLITAAFLDRLRGKTHGITAWSRFPLRMLSLQQTQRFANALAAAEIIRRREGINGAPFSLGFFVGTQALTALAAWGLLRTRSRIRLRRMAPAEAISASADDPVARQPSVRRPPAAPS